MGDTRRGVPRCYRLVLLEDREPVCDRGFGETSPRTRRLYQRPGVALHPQPEQSPVFWSGQPLPCLRCGLGEVVLAPIPSGAVRTDRVEKRQLVLPGSGQQLADEIVFGAEQKQQHAGARADRCRERAQGHAAESVLQDVAVRPLQQLIAARRRSLGDRGHPASVLD